MLDLDVPVRRMASTVTDVGGVAAIPLDLAADSDDPFTFYVLPPAPQVALAAGGTSPRVRLLRFVRDGKLDGGHLDLQIHLPISPAVIDDVRAQLEAEQKGSHHPVTVVPVTVVGAEAELIFVGSEATPDGGKTAPLARSYARITPLLDAPWTATFSVLLDAAGAGIVETALRSGAAPVGVIVRLEVEGLRPAQRVIAHVDWQRVYTHFSSEIKEGFLVATDDVQRLTEQLVESQSIRIEVVQALVPDASAPPADSAGAIAWIEREIVETCCRPVMPLERGAARASLGTVGDLFGVGASFVLKALTEIERSTADIDLEARTVVTRTLVSSAHLLDLLGGAPPDEHISDAGLHDPFFDRVSLHVGTARPLAATFTREVIAHFHYGQTDLPIRLATDGAADGSAETWADQAPDRTWSMQLEITLADDAPVDPGKVIALPGLRGQSRELTLDLEELLGLRSIDVLASPDPRVMATVVQFAVRRGGESVGDPRSITLTPATPRQTAWFRDLRGGDRIEAATKHLLADGRIVEVAPAVVDTRLYRLPPPFPGAMTVQVLADDDWSDLDRVVVSLEKTAIAGAEAPAVGTLTLDHGGASVAVSLDMPDPADRRYRYKALRTLKSGDVEEDDWTESDRSVLVVGRVAANMLVVDVTPVGLELPEAGISLIEVELQYIDAANQIRSMPTDVIRARADVYRWTVALKNPSLRGYEYRVTTHRNSGATQVGPWTPSSDRMLVIPVTKG